MMPAYAYPIKIDRKKKIIVTNTDHTLSDDMMTLADIEKIVGDNKFCIESGCEENVAVQSVILCVQEKREETDEEYNTRIEKDEAYMTEYNRRQKLKA